MISDLVKPFNEQFIVLLLVISFVELMVLKVYFFMQHEYVMP
jgi:hypothetical protein